VAAAAAVVTIAATATTAPHCRKTVPTRRLAAVDLPLLHRRRRQLSIQSWPASRQGCQILAKYFSTRSSLNLVRRRRNNRPQAIFKKYLFIATCFYDCLAKNFPPYNVVKKITHVIKFSSIFFFVYHMLFVCKEPAKIQLPDFPSART
jgi:hypothetical protein